MKALSDSFLPPVLAQGTERCGVITLTRPAASHHVHHFRELSPTESTLICSMQIPELCRNTPHLFPHKVNSPHPQINAAYLT